MDVLRRELEPYGVTVSILEPGFFKTSLCDTNRNVLVTERVWQHAPQAVRDEYGEAYFEQSTVWASITLTNLINFSHQEPHSAL